mgnify:FL=1
MSPRQQQGFTLLEVLLAGFILFLTIVTMSMVYRGALLSSSKADASLQMSAAVLPVREIISDGFRNGDFSLSGSGEGTYGQYSYSWEAYLDSTGMTESSIPEFGYQNRVYEFKLWRVEMILTDGSRYRNYEFRELSW